jgi:hypothetical protein
MYTVEHRPMTSDERRKVEEARRRAYPPLLSRDGLAECFFGVACGGFCVALLVVIPVGFLYIILSLLHISTDTLGGFIILAALAGAILSWRDLRKGQAERAAVYSQELSEGAVEVLHCTVADAVEACDPDGDPYYYLDVGDARLLGLFGGEVESLVEEGRFPNRELRWVRTPRTRLTLSFECLGEPFLLIRPVEDDEESGYLVVRHGDVFPGTLDTLEESLRQHQASQSGGNG